MRTLARCVLIGALAAPATAPAQVTIDLPLPTIHFPAPPPLVVVAPGVQVVEDYDDEVFFSDGWYWHRGRGRWYRTRDYRGGWVVVSPGFVPPRLVHIPSGRYRHYRPGHAGWHDGKRAWKAERRAERRYQHEQRRDFVRHHPRSTVFVPPPPPRPPLPPRFHRPHRNH